MKEKSKTYTAADFARYHAGTMPAGEMHELEKAALEDPFLEDALEGYGYASSAASDIEELQVRLAEKGKKKKAFSLSSFAENRWWRIAALFIIMAGGAYLFYRVNYVSEINSLAKNDVKVRKEREDSARVKSENTTAGNDTFLESQQVFTPEQKKKIDQPPVKPPVRKEYFAYREEKKSLPLSSLRKSNTGSVADSTYIEESKNENNQASKEYVLKGRIRDDKARTAPSVTITDKERYKAIVSDTEGNVSLNSPDSSITAIAPTASRSPKSFTLKKDDQPPTTMNKANANLNEVVVSGYGKRKSFKASDSLSNALSGKVAGLQIAAAHPLGGREKFDQYLQENIVPLFDANGERLTGEILLSFTINRKGKPQNINVVKSSCTACEKQAIKLLENGPKWTGKKDARVETTIKF